MNTCESFLVTRKLVKKKDEFFTKNSDENTPHLIAA